MRLKKGADIILMVVFIVLFISVGLYVGIKERNGEKVLGVVDIRTDSVWDASEGAREIKKVELPKEAVNEMPAEVINEEQNFRIIELKDTTLNPRNLEISVGTTVFWVNRDPKRNYQIYEKSVNQKFNSGQIMPNKSYNYTFIEPGVYNYGDAIFKYMFGTITVD